MNNSEQKREVYVIRHAPKGSDGHLTDEGRLKAEQDRGKFPEFNEVVASDSPRTQHTAELLTGKQPKVDIRAGFYMAPQEKSDAMNQIAQQKNIPFLDAAREFNDPEVNQGIQSKAQELNMLISAALKGLPPGGRALIVSHDLTISPAMEQRGVNMKPLDYLTGYVVDEDGNVKEL